MSHTAKPVTATLSEVTCSFVGYVSTRRIEDLDKAIRCLSCGEKAAVSVRYCAICGEPEGSVYAKHCCTDEDNMISDDADEDEDVEVTADSRHFDYYYGEI